MVPDLVQAELHWDLAPANPDTQPPLTVHGHSGRGKQVLIVTWV